MTDNPKPRARYSLDLHNSRDRDLRLVIEPWGTVYDFGSKMTLTVHAQGPAEGRLIINFTDDLVVVYGWEGSEVSLFPEDLEA